MNRDRHVEIGKTMTRMQTILSPVVVPLTIFYSGCATLQATSEKTTIQPIAAVPAPECQENEELLIEQVRQISLLQARVRDLETDIRELNSRSNVEKVARESLARRLEAAQTAREDAIREVVRMRARIQGMASSAEASAMFAEARVILDRMEEEAFSAQALEDLFLARSYMARGKGVLDQGNPGGAAYLFELIPGIYEGMKKGDPRRLKVDVSVAALREGPSKASRKLATLYWGESASGVIKSKEWLKIRTDNGRTGWIMKTQVQ